MTALGRIPSGLFVVTARRGADETGMLASWVQQCSFDPPQVTIAVRKGRYVLDWLTDGAAVGVNVIPEGQKALVAHFGKGFAPEEPAFAGLDVDRAEGAAPLLKAALAVLDCRVVDRLDAGDHVLVVAKVVGGGIHQDGKPTVHVRKNGLNY
ncbi:Diflavin flavoprotein [Fimbriiglobus ruber]|uniref:Diflavin flavoprotein n=1 Tax=Fimbriiglobus ruber TaxID=1908690 RepID=A0A225DYE9_9BACT|nr:Diflavin flavoprotein [Fimbriiglobus ruber]